MLSPQSTINVPATQLVVVRATSYAVTKTYQSQLFLSGHINSKWVHDVTATGVDYGRLVDYQ